MAPDCGAAAAAAVRAAPPVGCRAGRHDRRACDDAAVVQDVDRSRVLMLLITTMFFQVSALSWIRQTRKVVRPAMLRHRQIAQQKQQVPFHFRVSG